MLGICPAVRNASTSAAATSAKGMCASTMSTRIKIPLSDAANDRCSPSTIASAMNSTAFTADQRKL